MIAEHEQRVLDLIDAQQQEIEAEFEKFPGVTNLIWLTGVDGNDPVLGPEETDCHIDLMCRFVNEDTVLYGWHEQVDERALAIIGEHFPGRDAIGIDGRTIMEGGGFHCITKPQAAAPA